MKSVNIERVSIAMGKRKNNKELVVEQLDNILIIQGEEDVIVSKTEMDNKLKGLKSKYVVLKNTGHMAHIELPIKTKELILSFVE